MLAAILFAFVAVALDLWTTKRGLRGRDSEMGLPWRWIPLRYRTFPVIALGNVALFAFLLWWGMPVWLWLVFALGHLYGAWRNRWALSPRA